NLHTFEVSLETTLDLLPACGIPLTYRGISRGVTLVTAHTQDDSPLAWEALARSGTTLVVYMGVARLAEIQAGLLAGGMAEDTPLAMIENATLGNQRECRSNLGELLRDAGRFALKSPAILVIGEVTRDIVSQPISLSA
ncbi:SAM-dependent methyltransferase, partial [Pseudomonas aeruginosa]|uniref:SAM-dependent methyltransferase n=1 Tax=Pseudomonas aeruginosa TaxID=287 RepID=UPI003969AD16